MYGSVGGEVRCGEDRNQTIVSRDVLEDFMDRAISEKDEVVLLNIISGFERSTTIELAQREPLPFNVNSMVVTYDVSER